MNKLNILVIGRHDEIMETVVRLLNSQPGWYAEGALNDREALEKLNQTAFECVLMGGGVEETSERQLTSEIKKLRPQTRVIRHFGGGSGLLFNEIQMALERSEG
jgi:DNA-binding NtrC family response regulator